MTVTSPPTKSLRGLRVLAERPGLLWLDVEDPAGPGLDDLAARYGFHPLAVEDCRNRPQLAKLDTFPDHLFLIANSIRYEPESGELEVREIDVFLGERFIVTVHEGPRRIVETVAERLGTDPQLENPAGVLYALLDTILDRFLPTLDRIGETIDEVEEGILEGNEARCVQRVFVLKRNLVAFRRAASAQRELLNSLSRRDVRFVPSELVIYFRDVYDHVVATMEMIESYRDLLSGMLDIAFTQTANRTADVVKALTIIATIILPLTLVTGWYGMNMVGLPGAEHPAGIWVVSGGMAALTIGLLVFFRMKRWL